MYKLFSELKFHDTLQSIAKVENSVAIYTPSCYRLQCIKAKWNYIFKQSLQTLLKITQLTYTQIIIIIIIAAPEHRINFREVEGGYSPIRAYLLRPPPLLKIPRSTSEILLVSASLHRLKQFHCQPFIPRTWRPVSAEV